MNEAVQQVKYETVSRLVCCVCDTRDKYCCPNPDYFCSKNCEKLFLLMQGLVIGNILQSIFRDVCQESYYIQNKTNVNQTYFDKSVSGNHLQQQKSGSSLPPSWRPSILGHFSEHHVNSEPGEEETNVPFYVNPLCNTLSGESDGLDANSNDSSTPETVEDIVYKPMKNRPLACSSGVTTRSKHQASRNKHKLQPSKSISPSFNKMPKLRTKSKRQPSCVEMKIHSHNSANSRVVDKAYNLYNHSIYPTISDSQADGNKFGVKQEDSGLSHKCHNIKPPKRHVKCKRCNKMISKSYMYVHYRSTHKDHLQDISTLSLSCSECGKQFMKKQTLNAHKLKQHNHTFTNKCGHCNKSFASRFGLSWHMRQVHKLMVRQCGACGETFENRRDYKKHRRCHHAANSHVCHICGKGFKLKNALQAHLDAHAGKKLHFCELCGDGFVRFSSLCQHKNNLHGPKKSELPFKCHLCPTTFRLQTWLDKHIIQKHQSNESEVNADCELCQNYLKTFNHCPQHGPELKERFSCPQCNKIFAKDSSLKAHMKQHQEPKFSCDICQKKFTYKCNMQRHKDTHSAEKQFHCDICDKKFCSKFLLESHMRMHNHNLLFKCDICGKGLTRKDYLKNHLKKMHPEADRECIPMVNL